MQQEWVGPFAKASLLNAPRGSAFSNDYLSDRCATADRRGDGSAASPIIFGPTRKKSNVKFCVTKSFAFRGGKGDSYWPHEIKQLCNCGTATRKLSLFTIFLGGFPNREPSHARTIVVQIWGVQLLFTSLTGKL